MMAFCLCRHGGWEHSYIEPGPCRNPSCCCAYYEEDKQISLNLQEFRRTAEENEMRSVRFPPDYDYSKVMPHKVAWWQRPLGVAITVLLVTLAAAPLLGLLWLLLR